LYVVLVSHWIEPSQVAVSENLIYRIDRRACEIPECQY
jgi:hypothetical protein